MQVYIIGLGLIGGSFGLDIQTEFPEATIFGIDVNEVNINAAIQKKSIHKKATFSDLQYADLVIVSIPVDALLELMPKVLDTISENTLVFDTGSTKELLCKQLEKHPKRRNFLATHPIAGTEFSGPNAAINHLFKEKTNIICEVEKTAFKLQERALHFFNKLGMKIRYMDAKSHDRHIAYVSHLSHISSFMLGKTVIEKERNERDIFDLAGSGFASTVRLAKSSPKMWTPIFEQNKTNIIEILEEYIENLNQFKKGMLQDDFASIYKQMEDINYIKKILNGIN